MDLSTVLYAGKGGVITGVSENWEIFLPAGCVSMLGLPVGALLAGYPKSSQVEKLYTLLNKLQKRQLRKGSGIQANVESLTNLSLSSTYVSVSRCSAWSAREVEGGGSGVERRGARE